MQEKDNLIGKVLLIVEYMSDQRRRLSIQEISEELAISTTTVHRILSNLKERGYAGQYTNKSYYLTYKLFEVAGKLMEQDQLASSIMPYMNYFSRKYDCDMGLSACNDENIINLITMDNGKSARALLFTPGSVQPAYCTAAGKVFLSHMSDDHLRKWLTRNTLIPFTEHTIIDARELSADLEKVRIHGYALANEELMDGISCMAIPLYDRDSLVRGTLTFTVNAHRFSEISGPSFVAEVKETLKGKLAKFAVTPAKNRRSI